MLFINILAIILYSWLTFYALLLFIQLLIDGLEIIQVLIFVHYWLIYCSFKYLDLSFLSCVRIW